MKPIRFTAHAQQKLELIGAVGFSADQRTVEEIIRHPHSLDHGRSGRLIAQGLLDETHVLRVVYEEGSDHIAVVTLYPGRRSRYEI